MKRFITFALAIVFVAFPLSTLAGDKVENVNVVNEPSVHVSSLPPIETSNTIIPIIFNVRMQTQTNNPTDGISAFFDVPDGKIAIIEYVSATAFGDDIQDNEEFVLSLVIRPLVHFVSKLQRWERVTRGGDTSINFIGGGEVRAYSNSVRDIGISVSSNTAVGDYGEDPRDLWFDVSLSGRLVDATE